MLKLAEGIVLTHGQQSAGMVCINEVALQLRQPRRRVIGIGVRHAFESQPSWLNECSRNMQEVLDLSPTVMAQVTFHDGKATLYPTGVKLLDEALIEDTLPWLAQYPAVSKPFHDALRCYLQKDPNQYRSMLDNLRFSIEQMLRSVLNNEKSLENQKEEFLRWLAQHDAHSHIAGMYNELLFNRFAKYQNDAVKHQEDKYTAAEIEFALYVTGTFLRFIQRLIEG